MAEELVFVCDIMTYCKWFRLIFSCKEKRQHYYKGASSANIGTALHSFVHVECLNE